jgi:hypothetical protein
MVLRKIMGVFMITLLVGAASFATAGVPDLGLSTAATAYTGASTAVMFNIPNGGGSAFTAARDNAGAVDATVTLTLIDGLGAVIANFPAEDMWLESVDGGMAFCTGGTTADLNTDVNGLTQWVTPLAAGGFSQANTAVMISGAALSSGDLPLNHNSADISGDGVVNLTDVPLFVGDFYGAYNFRSDFSFDNVINLSDVVRMGTAIGASCP